MVGSVNAGGSMSADALISQYFKNAPQRRRQQAPTAFDAKKVLAEGQQSYQVKKKKKKKGFLGGLFKKGGLIGKLFNAGKAAVGGLLTGGPAGAIAAGGATLAKQLFQKTPQIGELVATGASIATSKGNTNSKVLEGAGALGKLFGLNGLG